MSLSTGFTLNLEGEVWCGFPLGLSGGVNIKGSEILLGLIENLDPPGDDLSEAVESGGVDDDNSVFTTCSLNLVGLIWNRPEREDGCDAGDFVNDVSLIDASSAKLLSSANECDEPEGLRMPLSRGLSTESRLKPYSLKISAGFFGTES